MIEIAELSSKEAADVLNLVRHHYNEPDVQNRDTYHVPGRTRVLRQVLLFGLVGGLNTVVDLLTLNGLLWLFPTASTLMLLAYNSLAYSFGAVNSFLLNKYWTFGQRQRTTRREVARFTLTTLCGIGWSSAILWFTSTILHPLLVNATVWANVSKVVAIAGTVLISYVGMRLWVFVSKTPKKQELSHVVESAAGNVPDSHRSLPALVRTCHRGQPARNCARLSRTFHLCPRVAARGKCTCIAPLRFRTSPVLVYDLEPRSLPEIPDLQDRDQSHEGQHDPDENSLIYFQRKPNHGSVRLDTKGKISSIALYP